MHVQSCYYAYLSRYWLFCRFRCRRRSCGLCLLHLSSSGALSLEFEPLKIIAEARVDDYSTCRTILHTFSGGVHIQRTLSAKRKKISAGGFFFFSRSLILRLSPLSERLGKQYHGKALLTHSTSSTVKTARTALSAVSGPSWRVVIILVKAFFYSCKFFTFFADLKPFKPLALAVLMYFSWCVMCSKVKVKVKLSSPEQAYRFWKEPTRTDLCDRQT